MKKTVVERISLLIMKYCSNDISDVQYLRYFCDSILKAKETQLDSELTKGKYE